MRYIDLDQFSRENLVGPRWETLRSYLDRGDDGPGWPPSALLMAVTCALLSGPDQRSIELGVEFFNDFVAIARQRWREGFYADPFTNEPKRRPL